MNKSIVAFALAASVLVAGAAFAEVELKPQKHGQCYTAEQLFTKDVEGAGGGQGTLHGQFAFRREQALHLQFRRSAQERAAARGREDVRLVGRGGDADRGFDLDEARRVERLPKRADDARAPGQVFQ